MLKFALSLVDALHFFHVSPVFLLILCHEWCNRLSHDKITFVYSFVHDHSFLIFFLKIIITFAAIQNGEYNTQNSKNNYINVCHELLIRTVMTVYHKTNCKEDCQTG